VGNSDAGPTPAGSLFWVTETVETLGYIKGSNKLSKLRYSFTPLNTHRALRLIVLVFPSPKFHLSVGVQTASRAAFVFVFQVFNRKENTSEHRDSWALDCRRRSKAFPINRQEQRDMQESYQ